LLRQILLEYSQCLAGQLTDKQALLQMQTGILQGQSLRGGQHAAIRRRLTAAGLTPNPIKEFKRNGTLLARFFFLQDPDGYKIEFIQRKQ